jgi:glycosyltransferase involved in cell wall biosynthesis
LHVLMVSRGVVSIGRRSGGAELVAFELARHLAQQGHQVTLIADVERPMLDSAPQGLSVRWVETGRHHGRLVLLIPFTFPRWLAQHFVGNVRAARRAVTTLQEHDARFDVVHTHGALATIMIARAMHGLRMDTQLIYTEHDSTPWMCVPRRIIERLVRRIVYRSVNLRACHRASIVVTNFAELASELAERTGLPPDRFATVPNGTDTERFSPADEAPDELVKLRSRRYCLYVGSLIDRKAPDLLLHALAKVDLGLVVVGEGPMGRDLRRLARRLCIADRVLFTGAQPQIAVRRYYQKAAFLVLPSVSEAVPLVVFEALSTGKPVVATELEGIASVVRHGENGLLVPPGNVEALSAALDLLANDHELYRRLASNAVASVRDRFSWDIIARQLHLLYARDLGSEREAARMFPGCEEPGMPVKVDPVLAPILPPSAAGPLVGGSTHA